MYQVVSETIQMFNGRPFYLCGFYFQNKGKRLHRAVWEYYNGEIPKGFHVHHKDGNRANNAIENLELMDGKEHCRMHSDNEVNKNRLRSVCAEGRAAAMAWHHSEEARELGRKNAHYMHDHQPISLICENCGELYETKNLSGSRFCSNACKSAYRRASGVDNETRTCPECGKKFEVNKYDKRVCCSRKCAWQARKKGRDMWNSRCVQHDG